MTAVQSKILLVGLEEVGKTSIYYTLKGIHNLLDFSMIKPTIGNSIQKIYEADKEITILELGGQISLRENHLNRMNTYLMGVKKIIYVIDIQKKEHYQESIEYFSLIVKKITDDINPELMIFLHKFDPDLENNPEFKEEMINKNLILPIFAVIPENLKKKTQFFRTTIFTVFKKTPIFL